MQFVVQYGDQFLKDMGRWYTLWVTDISNSKRFESRTKAEVFALTVGGQVTEVPVVGDL